MIPKTASDGCRFFEIAVRRFDKPKSDTLKTLQPNRSSARRLSQIPTEYPIALDNPFDLCYTTLNDPARRYPIMNTQSTAPAAPRENLSRGIFGAILFALAGGITYYVFWTVGIIAALSGLIGVICAIKGYEIFAGGSSKRGIAISVGVAAAVLVLTWYVCVCLDAHAVYEEMYALGEIEAVPPVAWCLANGLVFIPANPAALWDLLVSLGLAALGCWGYVARAVRLREEIEERQTAQARTMELARAQAEQAARAQAEQAIRTAEAEEESLAQDSPAQGDTSQDSP